MAKNKKALSDDEIVSICQIEVENSTGSQTGELSQERATAMDCYLGEDLGNEVEGRSQIKTREVLETIEWIKPSLMRIFADSDNLVEFDPVGPEDVEQAKIETKMCNHVFWKENRGFYNVYTFCTDALLSKNGILKVWWDTSETEEREEYMGLDPMQFGMLMEDESTKRELIEYDEDEQGLISATFLATRDEGRIVIDVVPPEEFGVSRDARSPYCDDQDFVFHRTRKSFSELVEMGYDPKLLRTLPSDDSGTQERLARRNKTDEEEDLDWSHHESMRKIWITECYIKVDRNGDDIAENLKVTLASGSYNASGAKLMDIEEVDSFPFSSASPILVTHKYHGLSIADLVVDLQEIKTTLIRQMLDNTYLANNGRTLVNDQAVNLDDLLTSRPGGIVRYKGEGPPRNYAEPIPHNPLPQEAYQMVEYLDEVRKQRTGSGDEVAGLDKAALQNVNTGVAALAYDAARMKIELVARVIAEIGFRPLFHKIHELLLKHQNQAKTIQIAGKFIPVNPADWQTRVNSTIMVGVGSVSRERKIMAMESVLGRQVEEMSQGGGGSTLLPQQRYRALVDWTDAWGIEGTLYWQDPAQAPPQEPQPDLQGEAMMMQAQAMMLEAQGKQQKNQIDAQKIQVDQQQKEREMMLKVREQQLKQDIETVKAQITALKNNSDANTKVASMQLQMEKQEAEKRLEALQMTLDNLNKQQDQRLALYKTQMDTIVKVLPQEQQDMFEQAKLYQQMNSMQENETPEPEPEPEEMPELERSEAAQEIVDAVPEWVGQLMAQNQQLAEEVMAMQNRSSQPKVVRRDENGLIIQIGDQAVQRNVNGQVMQIG